MKKTAASAYASPFVRLLEKAPGTTLFCVSFLLNLILETLSRRSLSAAAGSLFATPLVYLLNTCVILLTFTVALIFRKKTAPLLLVLCLWLALGIANFIVLGYRASPITAIDIILLRCVWDVLYVYLAPFEVVLIAVGICLFAAGLTVLWIKTPRIPVKPLRSAAVFVFAVASVLLLFPQTSVAQESISGESDIYGSYESDGFAFSFCTTFFDRGIEKPEGYTPEQAESLRASLGESKAEQDYTPDGKDSPSEEYPNIIFLQLESYFDVNELRGVTYSEDPTPVLTELKKSAAWNRLTVPVLGAGTANTEFEVLCGISSLLFGTGEYPYDTVLRDRECENIASSLAALGYRSAAVHNNAGSFYDRELIFKNLGFDDFISLEDMGEVVRNPLGWAEDAVLTESVLQALDADDTRDFVFAISVQAHGKYIDGDRMEGSGDIDAEGIPNPDEEVGFEYYLCQLKGTDAFVGALLSALKERPEPTVVVLYGDHLPSFDWTPDDLESESLYTTDYVVWSNYNADLTAPPLPAYRLCSHVLGELSVDSGYVMRLNQQRQNSDSYLSDMRLLAYDMLYGASAKNVE